MNYKPRDLDRVVATLSDPTRRLSDAGLITRSKHGRTVNVRLSLAPLRGATEWLRRYERFWSPALDRLAAHAERKETEARAAEAKVGR